MERRIRPYKNLRIDGIDCRVIFWNESDRKYLPDLPLVAHRVPICDGVTLLHVRNENAKADLRTCHKIVKRMSSLRLNEESTAPSSC